ncbi:MAG TPA: hypothetical protein VFQ77_02685 [Pseudonocardiaceae bacterium]|jgi:hypothetical protein|nr:hypothetical protein [Pseudonocardiaceae bacterium]
MSGDPPPQREEENAQGGPGRGHPLADLIDQLQQNWDQGDNAANDDIVVQIREHIRRQQCS